MTQSIHDAVREALAMIDRTYGGTRPEGVRIRHSGGAGGPYSIYLSCDRCNTGVQGFVYRDAELFLLPTDLTVEVTQHPCWLHPAQAPEQRTVNTAAVADAVWTGAATEATECPCSCHDGKQQ